MTPSPGRRGLRAAVATGLLLTAGPGSLRAQAADPGNLPEIAEVELRGVKSVPIEQLLFAISTKSSYCRLPLLMPVCWVVRRPLFVRKHYLEPGELDRDIVTLRGIYWQRGFREAQVDTVVGRRRFGLRITFVVREGPPTIIDTVIVEGPRDLVPPAAIERTLRLRSGAPLDLASLDTGLVALRNTLWDAGYGDAVLTPDIQVDDRARRAAVRIRVDPRWRTRVATIGIEGNRRLTDDAVRSALTLRPGGDFRRRDVLESQRYLYQSLGVAGAVIISPPAGDSLKHVEVRVQENPPRRVGLSVGLNTIEFAQVGARAGFFTLGGGRWQLDVRGAVGNLLARQLEGAGPFLEVAGERLDDADRPFTRPTWQGSAELARLWAGSPRNRLSIGAFGHRRSEPGVFVDRGIGALGMFTRELAERAPLSLGYRVERSAVDAGDVYFCQHYGVCGAEPAAALREPHRLASVTLNGWLDRSNDAVAPSAGYTLRLDMDHASRATGSEFHHSRVAAEATAYHRIGSFVLAARTRGGWVDGRSGASAAGSDPGVSVSRVLHPRALFYAGGVESVRGYGENQLGPRVLRVRREELIAHGCSEASVDDGSCDPSATPTPEFSPRPVGATTLLEGSVELRRTIGGSIGGILFADAAVLGTPERSAERVTAITPGAGLRYQANVGTLRLDVGWRPERTERLPVVVETVGSDGVPRVTRLAIAKEWSDVAGVRRHGALRRFTVHLVLGHAF